MRREKNDSNAKRRIELKQNRILKEEEQEFKYNIEEFHREKSLSEIEEEEYMQEQKIANKKMRSLLKYTAMKRISLAYNNSMYPVRTPYKSQFLMLQYGSAIFHADST